MDNVEIKTPPFDALVERRKKGDSHNEAVVLVTFVALSVVEKFFSSSCGFSVQCLDSLRCFINRWL